MTLLTTSPAEISVNVGLDADTLKMMLQSIRDFVTHAMSDERQLELDGRSIVERALVCPPRSKIGAITPEQRRQIIAGSLVAGVYEQAVDRESAYELLQARASQPAAAAPARPAAPAGGTPEAARPWYDIPGVTTRSGRSDSLVETVAKTAVRTVGVAVGRQIVRGLMGSILGGTTTRRR